MGRMRAFSTSTGTPAKTSWRDSEASTRVVPGSKGPRATICHAARGRNGLDAALRAA